MAVPLDFHGAFGVAADHGLCFKETVRPFGKSDDLLDWQELDEKIPVSRLYGKYEATACSWLA